MARFAIGTERRARTARFAAACREARYLPEGEGLGTSRPDSNNVGRIGPKPSMLVPRDLEG